MVPVGGVEGKGLCFFGSVPEREEGMEMPRWNVIVIVIVLCGCGRVCISTSQFCVCALHLQDVH